MPELELGQAADEGTELIILLRGQAGCGVAVLEALILGDGGIPFWLEEEEEEVEEVDAESVGDLFASVEWTLGSWMRGLGRTDVPALREDNPQEEYEEEHDGANPAVGCEGGGGIEIRLVFLYFIRNYSEV